MSDPNNSDEPVRTWEPMNLPEREAPDGVAPDPFSFFGTGNGNDD